MKRAFLIFLIAVVLTGCGAEKFTINENYDPNRNSQVLVGKYEDLYIINMTDGIYICSDDFSEAEQLIYEYCYNPYVVGKYIYYYGDDETTEDYYDGRIKCFDITTGNSKWIYSGKTTGYFAPMADGFIVADENKLIKLRNDGVRLNEYEINDMGYGVYSDDNYFYYVTIPDTNSVKILDLNTKKVEEVFKLSDGNLAPNILCDGETIYYAKRKDMHYYDFCKFDLNTKEHEVIVKDEFSEEFTVYDDVCYYYSLNEDKEQFLKYVDLNTTEVKILKELENDIYDINILDNKLFYRNTYFGKQIEMFDLEKGTSMYLYENFTK